MKKLIIATAFILLAGVAFGQTLQKGNLVGFHVMTINLDPDVTMNQYQDFVIQKLIPAWEKITLGVSIYTAKGLRGEDENCFAMIWVFESEEVRNKYFKEDGTNTELGNSAFEKIQPVMEKLSKLGTITSTYTDWLIQ